MKKFFAFSMCADFSAHVKREMSTSVCFFFSPATIYFVLFFLYFSFVFFFLFEGEEGFLSKYLFLAVHCGLPRRPIYRHVVK